MTTIIESNGSRWAGEKPATIEELIDVLGKYALNPEFEKYGNFISVQDKNWRGEAHPYAGMKHFFGNFFELSHVFNITTDDPETIKALTEAIRTNQATPEYKKAQKMVLDPIRELTCCCCGSSTKGRQWHNRDKGFGLCPGCIELCSRGQTEKDMRSCYGIHGYHYDLGGAK